MSVPTAAQNIKASIERLRRLHIRYFSVRGELESLEKEIAALTNLTQGVELGKRLAAETQAEAPKNLE